MSQRQFTHYQFPGQLSKVFNFTYPLFWCYLSGLIHYSRDIVSRLQITPVSDLLYVYTYHWVCSTLGSLNKGKQEVSKSLMWTWTRSSVSVYFKGAYVYCKDMYTARVYILPGCIFILQGYVYCKGISVRKFLLKNGTNFLDSFQGPIYSWYTLRFRATFQF